MLQFIGGLVIGTIAATFAMALVADKQADPKEQRIRELMTANKVMEAESATFGATPSGTSTERRCAGPTGHSAPGPITATTSCAEPHKLQEVTPNERTRCHPRVAAG